MARRLPSVVALVAILLLSLPTAALAYSARLERPSNGVVTGTTEVHVRVSREGLDTGITNLRVRPAGGGEWRPTECVSECRSGQRPVFKFTLDPRTGAPFGGGIMRNGPFEFEGRISREIGRDLDIGRFTLNLRVPGSAVGGLAATVNGETVRLAWSRAPEPDIAGYRVERCAGTCDAGGSWRAIGEVQPSASSHNDAPGVGGHSYRVVTVRSGGDGQIETVSSPVTAEVEPPPVDPVEQEPGDGDGDGSGGDGSGDGDGGDRGGSPRPGGSGGDRTGGDGPPRTGDAPDLDGSSDDGQDRPRTADSRGSSRTGGIRSGRAPSVSLGRGGSGIPELPNIGDIFRGELDYSADDPQTAAGRDSDGATGEEGDEVVLSAPGRSGGSFMGRLTDPNRIAVPIAGGLLMTAVGLHLWRWLRIPLA